jgi:formamidopyrimidine-DNA glycosylase
MPELPEVEVTRRELGPVLRGAHIGRVVLRRDGLRRPFPPLFDTRLAGAVVKRLRRRAKYLVADLSSGDSLIMHLGMSGSFRIEPAEHTPEPHDHVVFDLSSGRSVVFNDPRRFGVMDLMPTVELQRSPPLAGLGPEPLSSRFNGAVLAAACARSQRALKVALLDQRVVAGIGNIYASEALHLARVSPRRRAGSIASRDESPRAEAHRLAAAIKQVLTRAIDRQTGRPVRGPEFRVYERDGEPCPRRGCAGIIARVTLAGRSTFYCPVCQLSSLPKAGT